MESSTLPAKLDLVCFRGDSFKRVFTVTDSLSNPWDFTDCDVTFQITNSEILTKSYKIGGGISISGNVVTLSIPSSDTEVLETRPYQYDLIYNSKFDEKRTWATGDFIVKEKL